MILEVLDGGLHTTVQDGGRQEFTHLGVPGSGACDPWSLAVANLLLGNDPGAAVLEMTLIGPTIAVLAGGLLSLAGADLEGVVRETGDAIVPGRTYGLKAGRTIEFPGVPGRGGAARAYLALTGGVDVPLVLGSASTLTGTSLGGVDGRTLRAGDLLRARTASDAAVSAQIRWPPSVSDPLASLDSPIHVLEGPSAGRSDPAAFEALLASEWTVSPDSDRIGLRLVGSPVPSIESGMLSRGVPWGAIQIPPDGSPIVMLADHPTTGGYPVIAVAITADRPRLGQLRPGAHVRFVASTANEARRLLLSQRDDLCRGATYVRDATGWDELWASAGA